MPSIKWMGVSLVMQHFVNTCQQVQVDMPLATEGIPGCSNLTGYSVVMVVTC